MFQRIDQKGQILSPKENASFPVKATDILCETLMGGGFFFIAYELILN